MLDPLELLEILVLMVHQEMMAHRVLMVHQAHKDHQVNLGQLA